MMRQIARKLCNTLTLGLVALLISEPASARDIFIAAPGAVIVNTPDGSRDNPWPSLSDTFENVELNGGDHIRLLPGEHGPLDIKGQHYDPPLTIVSASQDRAHLDFIRLKSVEGLIVQDLKVWPRKPQKLQAIVATTHGSKNVTFENLEILTRPQTDHDYMRWSTEDWLGPWRNHGILIHGTDNTARGNTLSGVDFGITTTGARVRILENHVHGFSGDALRSLGDNTIVSGNRVENCIKVNENHDDGFQTWAPRGKAAKTRTALSDLTITNNIILEWTGPPNHPLRCKLQGVGMFDGPYRNILIANNVISVSAYHGISIYGGHDVTITHNTVVHSDPNNGESFPWIRVNDQKGGNPAGKVIVANNLAMGYAGTTRVPLPPFRQANTRITRPIAMFPNAAQHDYRPDADSPVIDAGKADYAAPDHDILGIPRPQGAAPDLGAYELR